MANGQPNGIPERPLDARAVASASAKMLAPREEKRMEHLLDALCDATRVKIVQALSAEASLAAGDIAHVIGRSRSATSQHLKVLRDIGAVMASRQGNVVRYSLAPDVNGQVIEHAVAAFEELRPSSSTPSAPTTGTAAD